MNADSSSSLDTKALRRLFVRMEAHLKSLERAHRLWRVKSALGRRLPWAALAAVVVVTAGRYVRPLYHPWLIVGTVSAGAAVVVAQAWGRRRSAFEVALWVDGRLGLDERVSSALAFVGQSEPTPLMRQTVEDASDRLKGVQPGILADSEPSRLWPLVPLLLILLPILAAVPPVLTAAERRTRHVGVMIASTGRGLQQLSRSLTGELGENGAPHAQTAVGAVGRAGADLRRSDVASPEAALERLQRARQEVDEALREDAAAQLLGDALRHDRRTRTAGEALAWGDAAAAASALREAANQLGPQDVGGASGRSLAEHLRNAGGALPPGAAQAAANRAAAGAERGRLNAAQDGLVDLAQEVGRMRVFGDDRATVQAGAEALRRARDRIGAAAAGEPASDGGPVPVPGGRDTPPDTEERPAPSDPFQPPPRDGSAQSGAEPGGRRPEDTEAGSARDGIQAVDPGVLIGLAGQMLEGERQQASGPGDGPAVDEAFSPVPPRAVQQLRTLGEAQLGRQDIPPGYRMLVRDYFTALEDVAAAEGAARPAQ